MKTKPCQNLAALAAAFALGLAGTTLAEEKQAQPDPREHADHEAKKIAGPNGGRVLTGVEPHLEFFVTPERRVKITFLGEDGKPVAPAEQVVTATGGDRSKPTRFAFSKEGGSLISDKTLPEGNTIPLVLQVKVSPDAKTVTEKLMVNLADCPGCDHKEYACTCDH